MNGETGSLQQLLEKKDLLVAVGPGGVGKTTISAAMGLEAARRGRNVLVLTIDPAKRLAQALGLTGLDDQVQEVSTAGLADTGVEIPGTLYAAMLDTGRSFDALMARVAPSAQARERILNNRVYRAMAGTLARSHAYIAMERLYEAMDDPRFDLVILDTPPTRNAIEILDAPGTLTAFLEENVVKWFVRRPSGGLRARLWATGSAAVTRLLGLLAGQEFLDEIIAFFESFYELRDGFRERAERARAYLRHPRSSFVVVSSADPSNLDDALALADGIRERGVTIEAAVFNRAYEPLAADPLEVVTAVDRPEVDEHLGGLWEESASAPAVRRLMVGIQQVLQEAAAANARAVETTRQFNLSARTERVFVARLEEDIRDLKGLYQLSPWLCRASETSTPA
ncbi:MAG: ArsA family ATPase [Nannocystaceae bacterium]